VLPTRDILQAEPAWHWSRIAYTDHKITAFNPEDPFVNYHKIIYPLQDIYGLEMNDGGRAFQVLTKRGGIKGALFFWIC
jgi:hypothetical protein